MEDTAAAFADADLTALEHYRAYGAFEQDVEGHCINPSNAFDANAYFRAKLYEIWNSDQELNGRVGEDVTMEDVLQSFAQGGLDPITHYLQYGVDEAIAAETPYLQTVPMAQRVDNDPGRLWNVPANYTSATPPPAADVYYFYELLPKFPMDVAGNLPASLSHALALPSSPLPVPGDPGYLAPPESLSSSAVQHILPPSSTGTGNATDYWALQITGFWGFYAANGSTVGSMDSSSVPIVNGKPVIPAAPVQYPAGGYSQPAGQTAQEFDTSYNKVDWLQTRTGTGIEAEGRPETQHLALRDADVPAGEYMLSLDGALWAVQLTAPGVGSLLQALRGLEYLSDYVTFSRDGSGIVIQALSNEDVDDSILIRDPSGVNPVYTYATTLVDGIDDDDGSAYSSLLALDTIYGFDYKMDKIVLPGTVSSLIKGAPVMSGVTAEDFAAAVAAANVGAGQAALLKHEGMYANDWYLFVNDGNAAFSETTDIVIKLAGVSDAEAAAMTAGIFTVA